MWISIDIGHSYVKCIVYNESLPACPLCPLDGLRDRGSIRNMGNSGCIRNIFDVTFDGDEMKIIDVGRDDIFNDNSYTVDKLKSYLNRKDMNVPTDDGKHTIIGKALLDKIFSLIVEKIRYTNFDADIDAVITVPVSFSDVQRERLRGSAKDAGIGSVTILTESFSGLYAHRKSLDFNENGHCKALLFDIGAGTIDACYADVERIGDNNNDVSNFQVSVLRETNISLGGNDVTDILYEDLFENDLIRQAIDKIITDDIDDTQAGTLAYQMNIEEKRRRFKRQLREIANDLKETIYRQSDEETAFNPDFGQNLDLDLEIRLRPICDAVDLGRSRNDIRNLINESPLEFSGKLSHMIDMIKFGFGVFEVNTVVFVGGGSLVTPLCDMIEEQLRQLGLTFNVCRYGYSGDSLSILHEIAKGALIFVTDNIRNQFTYSNSVSVSTFGYGCTDIQGNYHNYFTNINDNFACRPLPTAIFPIRTLPDGRTVRQIDIYRDSVAVNDLDKIVYMGTIDFPETVSGAYFNLCIRANSVSGIDVAICNNNEEPHTGIITLN